MAGTKKIVMTFGAFDGIHLGHIHYLKEAKKLGNYLIVAIARDNSKWTLPKRYNLPERERQKLVESLGIADKVIMGSTTDALEKIKKLKPDILALTPYHPVDEIVLRNELKSNNIKSKVVMLNIYKKAIYDKLFNGESKKVSF